MIYEKGSLHRGREFHEFDSGWEETCLCNTCPVSTVDTANIWQLQTVLLFNSLFSAVVISSFSQFIKISFQRHYLNISAKEYGKEPPRSCALKGQMTKDRKPKGHQRFRVWSEWSTLTTRLVWDTISGRKSLLGQEGHKDTWLAEQVLWDTVGFRAVQR